LKDKGELVLGVIWLVEVCSKLSSTQQTSSLLFEAKTRLLVALL